MQSQTGRQREELEEILQTALEVGVQIHRAGGYTARTDAGMRRVALALGADRAEPAITARVVSLTVYRGSWSRTAMRSAVTAGVNFSELTELSQLTKSADEMSATEVSAELKRIKTESSRYPDWVLTPAVGLATASLAGIYGADAGGMLAAGLAGMAGGWLRKWLTQQRFKPFVYAVLCAFVSTAVVLMLGAWTSTLNAALAACVLYLVPGVPLLNGSADLLTGFYLNGIARLTMASVVFVGASIGLLVALGLWGMG